MSISDIEELKNQLLKEEDEDKINNLGLNIANLFLQKTCFEESREYAERVKKSALINKDNDLLYKANSLIGMGYCMQGDPLKAKEIFMHNLQIANISDSNINKIKSLTNIGNADYNLHSFDSALFFYNKALDLAETYNQQEYLSQIFNNLANVYIELKKLKEARLFLKKALYGKIKEGNKSKIANTLLNFGNLYKVNEDFALAIGYYKRAMKIFNEINANNYIALCLESLASAYTHKRNYKIAIEYYLQALEICKKYKINHYMYIVYIFLAEAYYLDKNYEESLKCFNFLIENLNNIQNMKHRLIFYRNFAEFNRQTGNLETAIEYLNYFIKLNQKVYSEDIMQNTIKIMNSYENSKLSNCKNEGVYSPDIINQLDLFIANAESLSNKYVEIKNDENYQKILELRGKIQKLSK